MTCERLPAQAGDGVSTRKLRAVNYPYISKNPYASDLYPQFYKTFILFLTFL